MVDKHDASAFVNKRWDLLAAYKAEAVRADKARGFAAILQVVDELYHYARQIQPTWPTLDDREQDLETHRRVAAALAKTAPAKTAPAKTAPAKAHRRAGRRRTRRVR